MYVFSFLFYSHFLLALFMSHHFSVCHLVFVIHILLSVGIYSSLIFPFTNYLWVSVHFNCHYYFDHHAFSSLPLPIFLLMFIVCCIYNYVHIFCQETNFGWSVWKKYKEFGETVWNPLPKRAHLPLTVNNFQNYLTSMEKSESEKTSAFCRHVSKSMLLSMHSSLSHCFCVFVFLSCLPKRCRV